MVDAPAFDSRIGKMLSDISDWLTARDYDAATEEATARIVKKQSRGSISAQNGWYMTSNQLAKASKRADYHIKNLRESLKMKS